MAYRDLVLADGAVGYWMLGESAFASPAADETGNLAGTYKNSSGLTFGEPGISGGGGTAVRFIAANTGYVDLEGRPAALQVGDVFTLEAWVKRASTGVYDTIIAGGNDSFVMRFNNTDHLELIKDLVGGVVASTATVTDTDTFHHCVVAKNGATSCVVYLDGTDVSGSVTDRTISDPHLTSFGIGWDQAAAGSPADATICHVAVYPTALSEATVQAHYDAGVAAAPQTLLPSADSVDGAWTDQAGGSSLAAAIDEASFDDADYIRSDLNPTASGCRVKLSAGGDPHISTGHVINWRTGKIGSATINMTVKLYQGGGNSQGAGTLIASFDRNNVGALTTYEETLSGGEADSITDYTDLYLEFFADTA